MNNYSIDKFAADMRSHGLHCSDIIGDGDWHAFPTEGDRGGEKSGRYFLHLNGNIHAGYYGNWRDADSWRKWCSKDDLTPEESREYALTIAAAKAKRDIELAQIRKDARNEANNLWNTATTASDDHQYLKDKGLPAIGIRQIGNALIVPMRDADGTIHSLQRVFPDRSRRFLKGGLTKGLYHVIGDVGDTIYIAEGLSAAITVHLATKQATVIAFSASNIADVAQTIRKQYPQTRLVIAADDDQFNNVNAGRKGADAAAKFVNAVIYPKFGDLSTKPTDFDDLRQMEGLDEVKRQLEGEPFATMDEMRISAWLAAEPKPREWILTDIMPVGKTGMVVAPGGTGKSQAMLQLLISVATGLPLFGKFPVDRPGGALGLFAEDDSDELHRRFANCAQHVSDKLSLEKNLFIHSMVGRDVVITRPSPDGPMLTANFDRFIATAKQIPDLRLLVLDPVIRFRAGDENSASENTLLVEAGERISQETGAFVLWVNHANKYSMRMGDAMAQDAARGSSALTDGIRWQMNMATMSKEMARKRGIREKDRGFYVQMSIPKNNYAEPFGEAWLKRGDGGYLDYVELEDADAVENERVLTQAIQIIKERAKEGDEYSKRRFCERFSGRAGELKCGQQRLTAIIDLGIEQGRIELRKPQNEMRNVDTVLGVTN